MTVILIGTSIPALHLYFLSFYTSAHGCDQLSTQHGRIPS